MYHTVEGFDELLEALTVLVASSDSTELDKIVKVMITLQSIRTQLFSTAIFFQEKLNKPGQSTMITMAIYVNVALKISSMEISSKVRL